jgi:hypothetical protein
VPPRHEADVPLKEAHMWTNLLPNPLHAAIVHLPMALAVLLPLAAVLALVAIKRGAAPRPTWGVMVLMVALLIGSGLVAKETGEDGEDRVEQLVPDTALEAHEDAADRFLVVGAVVLVLSLIGLRRDRLGGGARIAATLGTVAVLAAGWSVGHAGGELTYRYGGAAAYAAPAGGQGAVEREED